MQYIILINHSLLNFKKVNAKAQLGSARWVWIRILASFWQIFWVSDNSTGYGIKGIQWGCCYDSKGSALYLRYLEILNYEFQWNRSSWESLFYAQLTLLIILGLGIMLMDDLSLFPTMSHRVSMCGISKASQIDWTVLDVVPDSGPNMAATPDFSRWHTGRGGSRSA